MDNNNHKKVWLITGASKGLGLSLTKQLLAAGHQVAATSRNTASLISAVSPRNNDFLPLQVDLGNDASVKAAIEQTVQVFSRIDVVVNNAGYGIGGSIEELTDAETRAAFDVNVFGTLSIIRHVLPHMRKAGSGHIMNIASIAGITAQTGWAVYGATKYAVMGLSEVLAADVKDFGIHVTAIAPGAFRTSFLTEESLVMADHTIGEYEAVRAAHQKLLSYNGRQAGDPEKAAAAMIHIASIPNPPTVLLLGEDAYDRATSKLAVLGKEYEAWAGLTKSTGFTL